MTAQQGDAYEAIHSRVLDRIEGERLDPAVDPDAVHDAVVAEVERYQAEATVDGSFPLGDPRSMIGRILTALTGYGPMSEILARPDVEEIFGEGDNVFYIDGSGRVQGLTMPTSEAELVKAVKRLLAPTERDLNPKNPLVQARVFDGKARLTAAIPPVADRLSFTLRKYTLRRESLAYLVERDTMTPAAAGLMWAAAQAKRSTLFSGPPSAGKTSNLAAYIAAVPPSHCIRACEEIRELSVPLTLGSCYETRPAGVDGTGEITLRHLVKFILAMRPDLLVVGEVRGGEAFELTRAVNAGVGFACTVHANSAHEALSAITNAALMAGENVQEALVRKVFGQSLDFVVHLERDDPAKFDSAVGIRRQVTEIVAVHPPLTEDEFTTEPIFVRSQLGKPLEWTGVVPQNAEIIERALPEGCSLQRILSGAQVVV